MSQGVRIGAAFIEVSADTSHADRDVRGFRRNVDGSNVTLNLAADTLLASRRIAIAARARFVDLNLRVNGLAAAGAALSKLSGASVLGNSLKSVGTGLSNLPNAVPKIAANAMAFGSMGAAALTATSNLLTLGGSIVSAGGAGLALPAILGGAAIGMGIFSIAISDVKKAMPELQAGWDSMKASISQNFWQTAAGSITNLTSTIGILKGSMDQVARSEGSFVAAFANAASSGKNMSALQGIFSSLNSAINIAAGAAKPLVSAFATLSTVGSAYIPKLATGFVTLSTKFNAFVQTASGDGRLQGWITSGIAALKSIGSIVGSVAQIFKGLFDAATAAGGSTLQSLADGLGKVAGIVNGPAFQTGLKTVFAGAAAGMSGLTGALGPIGAMFTTLAPTIGLVLSTLGQLAGLVVGQLASALSNPAITQGLTTALSGIVTGVQALLPSLPSLATAFGGVMSVVGTLAAALGPVLGVAIQALMPVIMALIPVIQPLITALGGLLVQAIIALMPVIQMLIPMITSILTAIMPVVTALTALLVPAIQILMPIITVVFGVITTIITTAMGVIQGIITVVTGLIKGNWSQVWTGIQQITGSIFTGISTLISTALGVWRTVISTVLGVINTVMRSIFTGISSFVSGCWNGISSSISGIINGISSTIGSVFRGVSTTVSGIFNGIKTTMSNIWSGISTGISNTVGTIRDTISNVFGTLSGIMTSAFDGVSGAIRGTINGVIGAINGAIGGINGAIDVANKLPGVSIPHMGSIPGLYTGGKISASGMALVGERGPELVTLPRGAQVYPNGTGPANVPLSSSSERVVEQTVTNVFHVTIDAKNVKDFQNVVDIMSDVKQTARTGRGVPSARVAF